MAGIQDVQPKSLSTLGQPLVGDVTPVVTGSAVGQLQDAFAKGLITPLDIQQRMTQLGISKSQSQVEAQKARLGEQQLKESLDPEAVAARAAQLKLEKEKAVAGSETLLSKDFVSAYLRYNLPRKKDDGSYDYKAMAEVGQKYADMERIATYAEKGLTGKPVSSLDSKGRTVTRVYNEFGEDITTVPDKVNPVVRDYQTMLRKARSYLLQNDDEPSVEEGKTPSSIEVSPKQVEGLVAPMVEPPKTWESWKAELPPAPVNETDPSQIRAWLFSSKVLPQAAAAKLTDSEALETYGSLKEHLFRPVVIDTPPAPAITEIVSPKQAAIVTQTEKPTLTVPSYSGEGLITGKGSFDPDKFVADSRATGLYKNWVDKSEFITGLRKTVDAYKKLPPGSITTQNDIDLATYALMLSTPGASAGGRGMEGLRLTKLEDSQPLLEELYGIKGHILKEHKFEEGTRNRIIEAAERKARVLEDQGRGAIKAMRDRLVYEEVNPDLYLDPTEKSLLFGSSKEPVPEGSSPNIVTVGGRKLQPLGNGQYRVVE